MPPTGKGKKTARSKRPKVISSSRMKGMGRKFVPARDIISPTTGRKLKKGDTERKVIHMKPSEYQPARVPDEQHVPKSLRIMLAAKELAEKTQAVKEQRAREAAMEAAATASAENAVRLAKRARFEAEEARPRFASDPVPMTALTHDFDDDDVFVTVPTAITDAAAVVSAAKSAVRREPPRPEQKINRPSAKRREDTMTAAAAAELALSGRGIDHGNESLKDKGIDTFEALDATDRIAFGERYDAPPALTAVPRVRVQLTDAEVAAERLQELKELRARGGAIPSAAAPAKGGKRKTFDVGSEGILGVTPSTFRRSAPLGYVTEEEKAAEAEAAARAAEAAEADDSDSDEDDAAKPKATKAAKPGSDDALLESVQRLRVEVPGETDEQKAKRLEALGFATAALRARGVALPPASADTAAAAAAAAATRPAPQSRTQTGSSALLALAAQAKGSGRKGATGGGPAATGKMSSAQRHRVMMAVSLARASLGVHDRQLAGGSAAAVAAAAKRKKDSDGSKDGVSQEELRKAVRTSAALDRSHPERTNWIARGRGKLDDDDGKGTGKAAKAAGANGSKGPAVVRVAKAPMRVGGLVEVVKGSGPTSRASAAGSRRTSGTANTGNSRRSRLSAAGAAARPPAEENIYARMARLAREQASAFDTREIIAASKTTTAAPGAASGTAPAAASTTKK